MQRLGKFVLKLFGWKLVGELADIKQYVLIVAPHSSNWDFLVGLFARFAVGVKINFVAKKQLFFFPLGWFLRSVGGAPVERAQKSNQVDKIVDLFRQYDDFKIALTPEGTRGNVTRWRKGFYYIADKVKVPIIMVGLDYKAKEVHISEPFYTTGDIDKDFPQVLDYYRKMHGLYSKEIPTYQK